MRSVYRPNQFDSKLTEQARKLVDESRELLELSKPDTFLGRKTHEPVRTGGEYPT